MTIDNVIIRKEILDPKNGKHSILPWQYNFRKTGEFEGGNYIDITRPREPAYWNRYYTDECQELYTVDEEGNNNYNLPYFRLLIDPYSRPFKMNYNLLLPKDSIAIAYNLRFNEDWNDEASEKFMDSIIGIYIDSIVSLGADPDRLKYTHNDILYDGKKFLGGENIFYKNIYSGNFVITCEYEKYIDDFSKLTGKYAQKRGMTGITDEVPSVTVDALSEEINRRLGSMFGSID